MTETARGDAPRPIESPEGPGSGFEDPEPITRPSLDDLAPAAAMGLMFIAAQLIALLVAGPFEAAGIRAFADPDDPLNPIIYMGLILGFTFIILLIAKYRLDWLIQGIILLAVGATMVYVFWPLLGYIIPDPNVNLAIAGGLALGLTVLLYKWPEWFVVDSVGVFVSAGATAIFGVSFGFFPALILLVLLAVYDYIAVYKTKHMLALADSVVGLRLPIMLVVPKHKEYSFLDERKQSLRDEIKTGKPREAMFMGLGDIVIPSVLVVIAYTRLGNPEAAIGALLGTFVGFSTLMYFVLRGRPHAGLPLLNGGSITGFMLGFLVSGAPIAQLGIPGLS
jgi:presenilin-like A22 family membrane protease